MQMKQLLKLALIALLSAGLTATVVACGDDESDDTDNQEPNNQEPNNQENNQEPNNQTPNNGMPNHDDVVVAPTCEDPDPPERCAVDDAQAFEDFYPASYVTSLGIADENCCVDFDGDGEPNNGLEALIGLASQAAEIDRAELNETIQESIDDGSISIVLEHEGLDEFEAGAEFDINFLFAEEVDGGMATIDPASFEQGTHPLAQIPGAEVFDDNTVTAGPGTVLLSLDIGALTGGEIALELDLTISSAQVVADASLDGDLEDGVTLSNGTIGGLLLLEDLADVVNDFMRDCDCLGNPGEVILIDDFGDLEAQCDFELAGGADDAEKACMDTDEELCGTIAEFCDFVSFVSLAADVDTDNSGNDDAISVGLDFDAEGVSISGVGDGIAAE